jgi:hypothetical protein
MKKLAAVALAAAGLAGLCTPALAQSRNLSSNGLTLTTFSDFNQPQGDANISPTSAPFTQDQLYKMCWYYRQGTPAAPNLLGTRRMSDLGAPVYTQVADNIGKWSWRFNGVAAGPFFDAELVVQFDRIGTTGYVCVVASAMTIRNIDPSTTLVLNLFHLVDMDLATTSTDDTISLVSPSDFTRYQMTDPFGQFGRIFNYDANKYWFDTGRTMRDGLSTLSFGAGPITDCPNATNPFGPADTGGVGQWTLTLLPGQQKTVFSSFAFNTDPAPRPADPCWADYNRDGFLNLDDLGDFITDFYTEPPIPGARQANAPSYPSLLMVGYGGLRCPQAPNASPPYASNAYRDAGYRVGFSGDGSNLCPLDPFQLFPNLDNLNDYITEYYAEVGTCG